MRLVRKNEKLLKHYVALAIILTVIVSVVLTIPTVLASRQLLIWLNTPDDILVMADAYIKVIFAGIFCTMSYNVASGLLRSIGDSKTPLYFLIFSSVLNIVLDIFFIVVVKAGTAGAAYATVISQGIAAVLSFIVMFKKYDLLRTSREDYYMDWNGIWRMLSIGLQMALNYSITAIGTMIFQAAVNVFGSQVVAAYTAASKVSNIATQTMPTLGTAAATYCGQNLGAGRYDRIFKGMKSCFFICIGCAVLAAAINCFVGPYMIGWFITSPTATDIDCAMKYLKNRECLHASACMDFCIQKSVCRVLTRDLCLCLAVGWSLCRDGLQYLLCQSHLVTSVCALQIRQPGLQQEYCLL